jgi:hypothetical protein
MTGCLANDRSGKSDFDHGVRRFERFTGYDNVLMHKIVDAIVTHISID